MFSPFSSSSSLQCYARLSAETADDDAHLLIVFRKCVAFRNVVPSFIYSNVAICIIHVYACEYCTCSNCLGNCIFFIPGTVNLHKHLFRNPIG